MSTGIALTVKFLLQRMVEKFNFHRYDNLRHAANKRDPRRERYESRGRRVVSLLFSAAAGDVTALRRLGFAFHRGRGEILHRLMGTVGL